MSKKPVYGFEEKYTINEYGEIFNSYNKLIKPAANASTHEKRFRLNNSYYDGKLLLIKSFFPEIDLSNKIIIFKDGNGFNLTIDNLEVYEKDNFAMIAKHLSFIYKENILPIINFNNYFISENGRVYSFFNKSKLLKNQLGTDGYYQVKLSDINNRLTHLKIHRLVAQHFIENPNNFLIVHHKDNDKTNNCKNNLEWTTSQQNNKYENAKPCCLLDKNNNIIAIFESISDLSREYLLDNSTASRQCRGIKNMFQNGNKVRFYDGVSFVPTKFD